MIVFGYSLRLKRPDRILATTALNAVLFLLGAASDGKLFIWSEREFADCTSPMVT